MSRNILLTSAIVLSLAVSACGGGSSSSSGGTGGNSGGNQTTTPAEGTATYDEGSRTFTATKNGKTYSAFSGVNINNQPGLLGDQVINGKSYKVSSQVSPSGYVAFGGLSADGDAFYGQSAGRSLPSKSSGSVEYVGRHNTAFFTDTSTGRGGSTAGVLRLTANFDTGKVTSQASALEIKGDIKGNDITGTASYNGNSGKLDAGFYGNELNGAATDNKTFVSTFATVTP